MIRKRKKQKCFRDSSTLDVMTLLHREASHDPLHLIMHSILSKYSHMFMYVCVNIEIVVT